MTKRFNNCADATENDIDRADGVDPNGFYLQMFTAQFGVWVSWATWWERLKLTKTNCF